MIILNVLSASFYESLSTVVSEEEKEKFLQIAIAPKLCFEALSALSGGKAKRATVYYSATGWCRSSVRKTAMINEIESEVTEINRELAYVSTATVLLMYDDRIRMATRDVTNTTHIQQHNNPQKGQGPVGNAIFSSLTSMFLACDFNCLNNELAASDADRRIRSGQRL